MHGTSRIVLRASALGLLTAAAVAACGDSSSDMEYQPGGQTFPQEDTGTGSTSGSSDAAAPDLGDDDAGDAGDAGEAGRAADGGDSGDASTDAADAGDATADADAGIDAGNDPTLGANTLSITFAGLGLGIDARILTGANFAGNDLNAWTDGAEVFSHGTTTLAGTGSAATEIAWGQWTAGDATDGATTYAWPANGGAIYVIGANHTGAFGVLGQLSATLAGTTPAISASGAGVPGTATGTAGLYDGLAGAYVGFNATVTLGADTYTLGSTGGSAIASTSELLLDANAQFAHTYTLTSASAYCGGTCNATVKGFVGGVNGSDLALVIHIYKNTSGEAASVSAGLAFTVP